MSSPREPKDPRNRWWNEWPLEGDPNRPAVWITKILSKSPRLIGWNDERMERKAIEAVSEATGGQITDISNIRVGIDRDKLTFVDFVSKEITKKLLNLEVKSGEVTEINESKKTLKDIGGSIFVDEETEPSALRDTELYSLALRSLQWQRDNYLVGREYAEKRQNQRFGKTEFDETVREQSLELDVSPYVIPFDKEALGNAQLTALGSWFIPSPTVQNALLPIVVDLPSGQLKEPILRATANLIPLSQGNLDRVVKDRLIWFLDNPYWRDVIKASTKGYITTTYRDAPRR